MINGYIDVNTRTGTLDANINSCAKETIDFNVSFDAGLTVAILSVEGKTLALSRIEEATPNSVTINTMTVQAYEHTHELGAGQSLPIVIAIGDSNHLQALVTGRMQFNSLYDKAPPEDLAPAYPTTETLKSLLAEMQAASNAAAQSATAARKSAEEADESAASAASDRETAVNAASSAKSYAEVATVAQKAAQVSAEGAEAAKAAAATSATSAQTAQGKAEAAQAAAKTAQADSESAATAAKTAQGKAEAAQSAAHASADDAESAQEAAASSATAAETAKADAKAAATAAQSAKTGAESAQTAAESAATAAQTAQGKAEAAEAAAHASADDAEAAKEAAASSETAAAQSASAAKASETAAANSATAASSSASAAAAAKSGAEAAKAAAETAKAGAETAKAAAASSAAAAANSATAAAQSATEAASQVTDTLKRINFCNGKFYSQYYNASSRSITWNENIGDACLMAWNDRYIIITTSKNVGWIVVNGSDFSFISSSPYHHSAYLYDHGTFNCLGFNGSRVAIFYRFKDYNGAPINNYAEVLDANTGEVLIEKTYTDEEMAFIMAAPCFNMMFTCILKNGDMIHRGTIFSGEDLSIKGYVAAEEGFAVVSDTYSTYCCYLTANADNSYSGEDPIIVQSNDTYSFWVDDRYTLGEDGEPIVTLRNFHVDGIFNETNSNTRKVAVMFSVYSEDWGKTHHVAAVRNPSTGKISIYDVSLDSTNDNIIAFSRGYEIDNVQNIYSLVPVNFRTGGLIYAFVPFYYVTGTLVYTVEYEYGRASIAKSPCISLQAYPNRVRSGNPYSSASVAYAKGGYYRPIPVSRFFYNNSSLIYPVGNV